ncbi:MAG: PhoU domain-containing protein [Candidatus Bathyarchaeia archaeon]
MKEYRRVQKVGHSTLSVSLPAKWVKSKGLRKGGSIFFYEENDGSLRIYAEPKSPNSEVFVVDTDRYEDPVTLARIVVGNYVLGRNIIRIVSSRRLRREQIEVIREVTQRLLGIGIVEEGERHLLLQSSIDPKSFPLPTMIKRLYMIVSTMFKEARNGLIDGDIELAKDAISREHEADTTYWLISRLLSSAQQSWIVAQDMAISDPIEIIHSSLVVRCLEMIGDHSQLIARKSIELEEVWGELPQDLMDLLNQISSLAFTIIDKAVESILVGDVKIASEAIKMKSVVELKENEFLEALQEKDEELKAVPTLRSIVWDIKRIVEYSSAMAEIAIDKALEKDE